LQERKEGSSNEKVKECLEDESNAKAISKNDKYSEKVLKHENKKMRVHLAKSLSKVLNNFFGHFG